MQGSQHQKCLHNGLYGVALPRLKPTRTHAHIHTLTNTYNTYKHKQTGLFVRYYIWTTKT